MIDDRCADGVSIALFRAQKRTPKYGAKGTTEKAYINRHASGAKYGREYRLDQVAILPLLLA